MNYFESISYFFNRYILKYRYDIQIKQYFLENDHNKAIQSLYCEGYDVKKEYKEILGKYKKEFGSINMEEKEYIDEDTFNQLINSKKDILKQIIDKKETFHIIFSSFAESLENKMKQIGTYNELKISIKQCDVLTKEIQRIIPIYKVVIIRKFAKFIEEKLILKFKDDFFLENYSPDVAILKKYKKSLEKQKLKVIADSLDKLISDIEINNKNKFDKKIPILKPSIVYSKNNTTLKNVHLTLTTIRKCCNSIIHFYPINEVKFYFNESFLQEFKFESPKKESENNNNEIDTNNSSNINSNNKNIIKSDENAFVEVINTNFKDSNNKQQEVESQNEYFMEISKMADYISCINMPNKLYQNLKKLKDKLLEKIKELNLFLNKIKNHTELVSQSNIESKTVKISSYNRFVKENIKDLNMPNIIKKLKKEKMQRIVEVIKSNIYETKKLEIENPNEDEERYLSLLNEELINYDLYSRYKFNLNVENYIELNIFNNELNIALGLIEESKNFFLDLKKLETETKKEYGKIANNDLLIENSLILFDFKKLFTKISREEFAQFIKDNLNNNEKINIFGKEISNTYLLIYLIHNKLYDENAYKSTSGIKDDYI